MARNRTAAGSPAKSAGIAPAPSGRGSAEIPAAVAAAVAAAAGVPFARKSDGLRAAFAAGATVAVAARALGVSYGFAYGVADRAGFAGTAANRRPVRRIAAAPDGSVSVAVPGGFVRIGPDGRVARTKSR